MGKNPIKNRYKGDIDYGKSKSIISIQRKSSRSCRSKWTSIVQS